MNLPEFITYCTIKGYVQYHEKMERWAHANNSPLECWYRVELQGRGYGATIRYAKCNGEITHLDHSLIDYDSFRYVKCNGEITCIGKEIVYDSLNDYQADRAFCRATTPGLDMLMEAFMPGEINETT